MTSYTALSALPFPQPTDSADLPAHMKALADAADGRTVLRFADAATRDAKITAPAAGMVAWLAAPGCFTYHNGTAWVGLGVWNGYTPTWTATTTNPTIGDGTIAGRYALVGKTCHFQMTLVHGSTTTNGSGAYTFGLPVAAGAAGTLVQFVGNTSNSAGRALVSGQLAATSGATGFTVWAPGSTTGNTLGQLGSGGVFGTAFSSGSFLRLSGTYETS
ncbi:hypothetical protein ACFZAU_07210 [Streptomyces sp. NPDC008238]